jgi:hypothetical protein
MWRLTEQAATKVEFDPLRLLPRALHVFLRRAVLTPSRRHHAIYCRCGPDLSSRWGPLVLYCSPIGKDVMSEICGWPNQRAAGKGEIPLLFQIIHPRLDLPEHDR